MTVREREQVRKAITLLNGDINEGWDEAMLILARLAGNDTRAQEILACARPIAVWDVPKGERRFQASGQERRADRGRPQDTPA